MTEPLHVAINGASGRMGRALLALLHEDERFHIVAAWVGKDSLQRGRGWSPDHPLVFTERDSHAARVDVVIDFSNEDGLNGALAYCQAHRTALVTGTTGVHVTHALRQVAGRIALLHAANFSLGVAVLARLLGQAASALQAWDLEIVEAHHEHKVDAPSGTARMLGEVAAAARGTTLAQTGVYVREGLPGARTAGSIGFAVVRGGDVVGEHTALLLGQGERLELGHRATDRTIFARGAIEAAYWLATKSSGVYSLDDLLAERMPS